MNRIMYEKRCKCNEESFITEKRKVKPRSEGRPLQYPKSNEVLSKTFRMKYSRHLSSTAKFILNSFHNKYLYYAIDDIYYGFKLNVEEQENLLAIIYSPVILLQNNLAINFFDIWIQEIYLEDVVENNRFLTKGSQIPKNYNYITIKLLYKTNIPVKKRKSLW